MPTTGGRETEPSRKAGRHKLSGILKDPNIKDNPVSMSILSHYTVENRVDTDKLMTDLLGFLNASSLDKRLEFLFKCYDVDGDGRISNKELHMVLKQLNRSVLDDRKIQNIVDRTFADVGEYKEFLTLDDFKRLIIASDIDTSSIFQ